MGEQHTGWTRRRERVFTQLGCPLLLYLREERSFKKIPRELARAPLARSCQLEFLDSPTRLEFYIAGLNFSPSPDRMCRWITAHVVD